MIKIDKSLVHLNEDKVGLTGEASTMGLAPGEWPDWIAVTDSGNDGFLFGHPKEMTHRGEFAGKVYNTNDGAFTLTVFND
jgi:hypothetical protein